MRRLLTYKQTGTVLDIGCGAGRHAVFLAQHGFTVTAIDTDPEKVTVCTKRAEQAALPIACQLGDLTNGLPDEQYDVVVMTMVLHFLEPSVIRAALAATTVRTKPFGVHAVTVLTDANRGFTRPHLFAPGELRRYYSDWGVLEYEEGLGAPFASKDGGTIQQHRAALIALKKHDTDQSRS